MKERIVPNTRENIANTTCQASTLSRFLTRLEQGSFSREENRESHFCAYFLPINPETQMVFLVDHIKAKMWLSPGGHIDPDETAWQTVAREFEEELGVKIEPQDILQPFLLTITEIDDPALPCREHYDFWYLVKTNGQGFQADEGEFNQVTWCSLDRAKELVTDPNTRLALEVMAKTELY